MPRITSSSALTFNSGECASHFQQHIGKYPPQVSSRKAAAGWGCFIHNEVNTMLEKPEFDCSKLGSYYDCGCAEEPGEGETKKASEEHSTATRTDAPEDGSDHSDHLAVEISKEE